MLRSKYDLLSLVCDFDSVNAKKINLILLLLVWKRRPSAKKYDLLSLFVAS